MNTNQVELTRSFQPLTPVLPAKESLRQNFLMCAADLYEVDYVINPWMAGHVRHTSRERAALQWSNLHRAISSIADVFLIDPQPGSPDMVFTANAGLIYRSREAGDSVAVSRFFHPERQGEEPHFRSWFEASGYTILEIPHTTPFEGEGDALFSSDRSRLWAGHGSRTLAASHQILRDAWGIDVVPLHLVDPRFYHLDTCFAPLTGGFVLYYPAAFDAASLTEIEAFYPPEKRILVEEADAIRFACNVVNVDRTLILNSISANLSTQLEFHGFEVIQIELTEFMKAGGAAKCLVLKLP